MITTVILAKNEEKNIERCIKSILWCDEIVVVDDYSEDDTVERVKGLRFRVKGKEEKIKIYKRLLNGDFAGQRNYGLSKAKGEWVLFIDSDEVVSSKLAHEIKQVLTISKIKNQNSNIGYYIKRRDYLLGKWLKYGETSIIKLLRLAKKNAGGWKGRVHEVWEVGGEIGEINNPILHYPHPDISEFLRKVNNYTDLVAQYWQEEGRSIGGLEIIFYPTGKFIQNYVLRLGFLDGIPGLIMAVMMSFHSFLARGKLWLKLHP